MHIDYPDGLEEIYESSPCGMLSMLASGQILQANRRFLEWVGIEALRGHEVIEDFLTRAGRIFMQTHFMPLMLVEQGVQEVAIDLVGPDSVRRRVLMNATYSPGSQDRPAIFRVVFFHVRDRMRFEQDLMQSRRAAEQASAELRRLNAELAATNATLHLRGEELHHLATHDHLTSLLNRQEFERRLGLALSAARAEDAIHTLLFLDLDRFKQVNDVCGHAAGDALLKALTGRMRTMLRRSDVFARLGGDEFGVLLHDCSIQHGERIALELLQTVRDFVLDWDGQVLRVGVSVGVVSNAGCSSVEDWSRKADAACYRAKQAGRDRVEIIRDELKADAAGVEEGQVGARREAHGDGGGGDERLNEVGSD